MGVEETGHILVEAPSWHKYGELGATRRILSQSKSITRSRFEPADSFWSLWKTIFFLLQPRSMPYWRLGCVEVKHHVSATYFLDKRLVGFVRFALRPSLFTPTWGSRNPWKTDMTKVKGWGESVSTISMGKNTRNYVQCFLTLVLFAFYMCCILRCVYFC